MKLIDLYEEILTENDLLLEADRFGVSSAIRALKGETMLASNIAHSVELSHGVKLKTLEDFKTLFNNTKDAKEKTKLVNTLLSDKKMALHYISAIHSSPIFLKSMNRSIKELGHNNQFMKNFLIKSKKLGIPEAKTWELLKTKIPKKHLKPDFVSFRKSLRYKNPSRATGRRVPQTKAPINNKVSNTTKVDSNIQSVSNVNIKNERNVTNITNNHITTHAPQATVAEQKAIAQGLETTTLKQTTAAVEEGAHTVKPNGAVSRVGKAFKGVGKFFVKHKWWGIAIGVLGATATLILLQKFMPELKFEDIVLTEDDKGGVKTIDGMEVFKYNFKKIETNQKVNNNFNRGANNAINTLKL